MLSLIKSRILINLYGYARGLIHNERFDDANFEKCEEYSTIRPLIYYYCTEKILINK
ncbi:hypothetical protein [Candidatus Lariskella endosymbiont of Epinotia ramella]|uniref:hypothetical protein n=1 Tax=Candidatus Lariskella endosymbiont of Epinotia ramella TaxID=3066224 RepID=UPI0030CEB2DD